MKKIKRLFVLLISAILFLPNVFTASATLSVSSNSITVEDSFTVSVHMSSAATWNIHVTASAPQVVVPSIKQTLKMMPWILLTHLVPLVRRQGKEQYILLYPEM